MAATATWSEGSNDHLESLGRDECLRRLAAHGVGRLGVASGGTVGIYPVNYLVEGDEVIVRVRRNGELDRATRGASVAIEIDHADNLSHEGWSVLVQGRCRHVMDPADLAHLARLPLLPWGGSDRDHFLRIAIASVSGRHIHHRKI